MTLNNNQLLRILKKFNKVLNKRQKRHILIIIMMMLIGAMMETLGVSMIVPLVTTIMDTEFFSTNRYVVWISDIVHIKSEKSFIILMLSCMIVVFIIKNIYLLAEYYIQQKFICNNRISLQKKVLRTILKQEYFYFLDESTGNILRTVIDDVEGAYSLLNSLLEFFTEACVCTVLFLTILAVDSSMAIFVVIVLAFEMIIIIKYFRPKMFWLGKERRRLKGEQNKWIMQAITGIKETKIGQKERFFEDHFGKKGEKAAKYQRNSKIMESAPRLIIESVTISAVLFYLVIILQAGKSIDNILPQLSAFAVAAMRLLPSINRLTASYNLFAYFEPNLDGMMKNLILVQKVDKKEIPKDDDNMQLKSMKDSCGFLYVTYSYPNTSKKIFDKACMDIPIGKSVGIIGESGAGKTTAVDILLGLLKPDLGIVYADGHNIMDDYSSWLKHIAYIPQTIFMMDDTIAANVAYGVEASEIDEQKIWNALKEAHIDKFVANLENGIYTEIGERGMRLSGGQRQRIGIARALYNNPALLIFDEATSALDNETEAAIMESINSLHGKKTLIIIAHRLTTIAECDIVYKVKDGKIKPDKIC